MLKQPILSICIPTYNRSDCLDATIKSVVSQKVFQETSDVELVISDNASTDGTPQVVGKYVEEYPDKIFYLRNEKSVHSSDNFCRVLSSAHGEFLKLNNDTLTYRDGGLERLLSIVKENLSVQKPIFLYHIRELDEIIACGGLDEFVKAVSYFNTWIGAFCLWKKDLAQYLEYFITKRDCQLAQTYILFEMCVRQGCLVYYYNDFASVTPKNKGGYNVAEVFGHNYVGILKEYLNRGLLSKEVYEAEKRKVLLKQVNVYYFDLRNEFAFEKSGYFKWLWADYKFNLYFWIGYVVYGLAKIVFYFGMKIFGSKWHMVEDFGKRCLGYDKI